MIETPETTVSLALHPRLTVVTGVDASSRWGLCSELAASLVDSADGVHAELVEDRGRTLAIFRPTGQSHRVVDTGSTADVSAEFSVDGRVDLLKRYSISAEDVRPIDTASLAALQAVPVDPQIARLAEIDQAQLWGLARRVELTTAELEASLAGSDRGMDADTVDLIEDRHHNLETAAVQLDRVRRNAAIVATVALATTVPLLMNDPGLAVWPALIAGLCVLATFFYRRRADQARDKAREALSIAGADSYLGYMVSRVDGLFDGTKARRRQEGLAEDQRDASIRWNRLTNGVSVTWALEHRDEITAAADLKSQLRVLSALPATMPGASGDQPEAIPPVQLAGHLIERLYRARRHDRHSESLPVIIDDVFEAYDQASVDALLEIVNRRADPPQVIVVTGDGAVADWARRRAAGHNDVGLVEPALRTDTESNTGDELAG